MERTEITTLVRSCFLFSQYAEEELDLIVDRVQAWEYRQGQAIFEQGQAAKHLFLVYSGKVSVAVCEKSYERPLGIHESGDVFGYDVLQTGSHYQTRAVARTDAVVLGLDQVDLAEIMEDLPSLRDDFAILLNSYLLDLQHTFSWRDRDEVLYYISRRHPLDLISHLAPLFSWSLLSIAILGLLFGWFPGSRIPLILGGINCVIILAWFILAVIDWSNDFSVLSNRRVIFQEKVILLYDSRHESPLRMVMGVTTQSDWFGRQFGYGNVLIRTYAGQVTFPKVPDARRIAVLINHQTERAKNSLLAKEQIQLDEVIRETIGLRQKTKALPSNEWDNPEFAGEVLPDVHSGSLVSMLADLFRIRKEENGIITYWTHWFVLLKRIVLPSMLLLVLAGSLISSVLGLLDIFEPGSILGVSLVAGPFALVWWLYQFTDWRNDQYIITPEQVIDIYRKPLGHEERKAAPLKNILSIEFERHGLIGLVLNFGTVYIKVGESTLTFDYVHNPSEVQRELFSRLAARDELQKSEQQQALQKNMAGWIEAYHRVASEQRLTRRVFPNHQKNPS